MSTQTYPFARRRVHTTKLPQASTTDPHPQICHVHQSLRDLRCLYGVSNATTMNNRLEKRPRLLDERRSLAFVASSVASTRTWTATCNVPFWNSFQKRQSPTTRRRSRTDSQRRPGPGGFACHWQYFSSYCGPRRSKDRDTYSAANSLRDVW